MAVVSNLPDNICTLSWHCVIKNKHKRTSAIKSAEAQRQIKPAKQGISSQTFCQNTELT